MTPSAPAGPPAPRIVPHKGKERRGRPRKDDGSFVMTLEKAVELAADNIVKANHNISQMVGDRKYGERKVNERDQVRRYAYVKDSQEMWASLIEQFGIGAAVEYALRLSALSDKYPEDAKFGEDAATGERKRQELGI